MGADGIPAGDGRGRYGGRAPILEEAMHEAAAYDVDTRTFHTEGLRAEGVPGVAPGGLPPGGVPPGGGEGGATEAYADAAAFLWGRANGTRASARGRFWAREPTPTGRMLDRTNAQARSLRKLRD